MNAQELSNTELASMADSYGEFCVGFGHGDVGAKYHEISRRLREMDKLETIVRSLADKSIMVTNYLENGWDTDTYCPLCKCSVFDAHEDDCEYSLSVDWCKKNKPHKK